MTYGKAAALAAGFGLAFAVGCGGAVSIEAEGGGGSGTGATSSSTTTNATATTSTGSGGACAGFEDEQGSGTVTIRFRNESGLPIYLPSGCSNQVRYSINPAGADNDIGNFVYEEACFQTCADLQKEPQYACGACAPSVVRLDPGATRVVTWKGTVQVLREMPSVCWNSPGDSMCGQVRRAWAMTYRAEAWGHSDCGQGCTCDSNGLCNGYGEGLTAYADPVKFEFPSQSEVDLVFGGCAFGCPGGGE